MARRPANLDDACRSLSRAVSQSPFGDLPDSSSPPFNACQLLAWADHGCPGHAGGGAGAETAAEHFAAMAVDTLRHLEAKIRAELVRQYQLLSATHAQLQSEPSSDTQAPWPRCAWVRLPTNLRCELWARYGAEAQAEMLDELAISPPSVELAAAGRVFGPLSRLARRICSWHSLLGIDVAAVAQGVMESPIGEDERPLWPSGNAWSHISHHAAGIAGTGLPLSPLSQSAAQSPIGGGMTDSTTFTKAQQSRGHGSVDGLEVTLRVERSDASRGDATKQPPWWQVRTRLECRSAACTIHCLIFTEDVQAAHGSDSPQCLQQLSAEETVHLENTTMREVIFEPPVTLRTPGDFVEVAVRLRVDAGKPHVATRPPVLKVAEVCAEPLAAPGSPK